jgi:hypothetical protein
VVVVVGHPRLITGYRAPRCDASHKTRVGECPQYVVDGLGGDLTEILTNHPDDRVGVGMRMGVQGVEYSHPGTRHAEGGSTQQVLGIQRCGHTLTFSHFLESVKISPWLEQEQ